MTEGEATTPDWVKDAIFYQIFPDRFARSAKSSAASNLQPWGLLPPIMVFRGEPFGEL